MHAFMRKDLVTAGDLYDAALAANSSESLAWLFHATRFAYLGLGAEAKQAAEQALRLSPLDPLKYFYDSLAATAMLGSGQWERALSLSRRSLLLNRRHAPTWRTIAFASVMLGRMDDARQAAQQLLAIEPGYRVSSFIERFPGRDGPLAGPWSEALGIAGVPA